MLGTLTRLPTFNTQWIIPTLARRWGWIVACTLAVFLAGFAAVIILQPQYAIATTLIFKVGREQEPPPLMTKEMFISGTLRPEAIAAKIELLESQYLMAEVVRTLGEDFFKRSAPAETVFQRVRALARSVLQTLSGWAEEVLIFIGYSQRVSPTDKLVARLRSDLSAEQVKRSDVVAVSFTHADKEVGVKVLETLVALFIQRNIDVYRTPFALDFLASETNQFRRTLDALEAQRLELQRSSDNPALTEERTAWVDQLRQLNGQLETSMSEVRRLQAEVPLDRSTVGNLERRVTGTKALKRSAVAEGLDTRLTELESRYQQRRDVFQEDSEPMKALAQEIERVKQAIKDNNVLVTVGENSELNTTRIQIEREMLSKRILLEGEKARADYLRLAAADVQTRLMRMAETAKKMRELDREIAAVEKDYLSYRSRMEDMRMSEAMDKARISNVAVFAPPVASIEPVRPRKLLFVLGGLLAGLFGSIGVVLTLELLRPSVHSRQSLATVLGVPVLGRLPEVAA